MFSEMFIRDQFDPDLAAVGVVSLHVAFTDAPARLHVGVFSEDCTREQFCHMLRELALHIEYDITGDKH